MRAFACCYAYVFIGLNVWLGVLGAVVVRVCVAVSVRIVSKLQTCELACPSTTCMSCEMMDNE